MNNASILVRLFLSCFTLFSVSLATTSVSAYTLFSGLGVQEYQPQLPCSGRVDAVAVNPNNFRHVLVATESGGLFKGPNNSVTWYQVDTPPAMNLRAVHFVPNGSTTWILVTATAAFENRTTTGPAGTVTGSNGGIWISRNGGHSLTPNITVQ
jgi:hypothetical protein